MGRCILLTAKVEVFCSFVLNFWGLINEVFFKVANVRHSQLLESHFKGIILAKIITNEGRTIKYE